MIKPSDTTVIIPHLGATEKQHYSLNQCLRSLRKTVPDIKIIVAKNGKDHIGEPIPIDFYEYGEKIALSEQGQCKAVNAAAATVSTPWLFITNDDMIFAPSWWERLTNFVIENVSCVSPVLVEPQEGAPPFIKHFCGGAGGDFNMKCWLDFARDYKDTSFKFGIEYSKSEMGFNFPLLIKKDLWDTIGGYDINYDPWGSNSDSDLQAKIHLAGAKTYRNRNCIVYHFSTTSGTFHPDNRSYWQKNWDYFKSKWGFERKSSPDIWYSRELIDYDKLKYKPRWMGCYEN